VGESPTFSYDVGIDVACGGIITRNPQLGKGYRQAYVHKNMPLNRDTAPQKAYYVCCFQVDQYLARIGILFRYHIDFIHFD
jgi:hypothetical protein